MSKIKHAVGYVLLGLTGVVINMFIALPPRYADFPIGVALSQIPVFMALVGFLLAVSEANDN